MVVQAGLPFVSLDQNPLSRQAGRQAGRQRRNSASVLLVETRIG